VVLVVVGIIVVIVPILYPVFSGVRENGRMAKCISDLHQWGTAIQMHRDDWGGVDPEPGRRINSMYELGFPLSSEYPRSFSAYGMSARDVRFCPSARELAPGRLDPYYTFFQAISDPDPVELEAFAKRGGDVPLMACLWHNAEPDPEENPTWGTLRVLVLRVNQRVHVRRMPTQTGSSWTW
jgi:hypothetical protein